MILFSITRYQLVIGIVAFFVIVGVTNFMTARYIEERERIDKEYDAYNYLNWTAQDREVTEESDSRE
jgi:hypothetical protein